MNVAIGLLLALLGLSLVTGALKIWNLDPAQPRAMVILAGYILGILIGLSINSLLIYRLAFAKKWARATFLIIWGTGVPRLLYLAFFRGGSGTDDQLLRLLKSALLLTSALLMFFPEANRWFKATSVERSGACET